MKDNKSICRGIVLGGGGTKGAYEAGVWHALHDLDIDYHVVVGTSIGAMNGAMMVQGDLEETLHLWRTADNTTIMKDVPKGDDMAALYHAFAKQIIEKGGIDITPMEDRLRKMVKEDLIRKSDIEFGLVTVDMSNLKAVELFLDNIPEGKLHDFILASATCFPAFKPRDIDGTIYVDGGYRNNIPISLVLKAKQKVDEIIAVDVNGIGYIQSVDTDIPVKYISSYWSLGNMLVFSGSVARRNLTLGYNDTMKEFGHYQGQAYTFHNGQLELLNSNYLEDFSVLFLKSVNLITPWEKSIIQDILTSRIIETVTRGRKEQPTYHLSDFLLTLGELAAEMLELDPATVYNIDDFNTEILERYNQLSTITMEVAPILFGDEKGDWLGAVKKLKVEQLLVGARQMLHLALTGKYVVPLNLLIPIFPKEFLAALYIQLLQEKELYII